MIGSLAYYAIVVGAGVDFVGGCGTYTLSLSLEKVKSKNEETRENFVIIFLRG